EQVGALVEALDASAEGPRLQVRRRVEGDPLLAVVFVVDGHHPPLRRLVPQQPRVAPGVPDHGIAGVLLPGAAAVGAVGYTLAAARAGEGGDERRLLLGAEAGGVVTVDD